MIKEMLNEIRKLQESGMAEKGRFPNLKIVFSCKGYNKVVAHPSVLDNITFIKLNGRFFNTPMGYPFEVSDFQQELYKIIEIKN